MVTILTHTFYALAIFAIIYEIKCILNPGKAVFMQSMLGSDEFNKVYAFTMFLYGIWAFIGLFTHLWVYFLFLLLITITNKKTAAQVYIASLMALNMLFLILINKYIL